MILFEKPAGILEPPQSSVSANSTICAKNDFNETFSHCLRKNNCIMPVVIGGNNALDSLCPIRNVTPLALTGTVPSKVNQPKVVSEW
jgi:hypothetical protein